MLRDKKLIQEKIINAINYFKTHKKKRPTSEEIYNFVSDGYAYVDFNSFKDAMRELKIQRKIYNEKKNGVFCYFIPRVPEIILKLDKSNHSEDSIAMTGMLQSHPLKEHRGDRVKTRHSDSRPLRKERDVFSKKASVSPLQLADDDSAFGVTDFDYMLNNIQVDNDDDDDDIKKLEAFIDRMIDRLDDVVIREPPANIISLYEQRIFDLKSEVLFLRKLTSSNNTILQEEIRFLRKELDAKNSLIKHLTDQLFTRNDSREPYAHPQDTGQITPHKTNPYTKEISKALTVGNKHLDNQLSEKKKIEMMGDSMLKEIYDVGMKDAGSKNGGRFSSFNIFDHIKHGVVPRHNGVSFHVDECDIRSNINIPKMFDGLFGSMVSSPFKQLRNQVVITEVENDTLSLQGSDDVDENKSDSVDISDNEDEYENLRVDVNNMEGINESSLHGLPNDKLSKMEKDNLDGYRGWLSLDIMDNIKPSLKRNSEDGLLCFAATDLNLLKICENMSEQVNSINVKLRNYCDQRRIIYDGGNDDDPCLNSLTKLPLNCKNNNLLTNSYVNCRIAT